jgi:hypothetical protein
MTAHHGIEATSLAVGRGFDMTRNAATKKTVITAKETADDSQG